MLMDCMLMEHDGIERPTFLLNPLLKYYLIQCLRLVYHICGVMVSLLASSVVYRGFEPWYCQSKV